jgi:hypothetical protein
MRLSLLTAAAIIGCTLSVHAQTTTLGTLRPSNTVVTQEVDTVALAALSASNTAARAAITNEALYRAQADAANLAEMLASNAVATAALAAEALARYVAITNASSTLISATGALASASESAHTALLASNAVATAAIAAEALARYVAITNASSTLISATNALDAATIARDYPRSNPSNWITSVTVPQYVYQPWITISNLTGSVTITNVYETPIALVGTGALTTTWTALRSPLPLYVTAQGFDSLTFPASTYFVGGGSWQTNRINHFIIWLYGTNLYVNPAITTVP